jgi:hypothetical protein
MRKSCPTALAALTALVFAPAWAAPTPTETEPVLKAVLVGGSGPILDPFGVYWEQTSPTNVSLMSQEVALPHGKTPAVQSLEVRAAHNGQYLALRLRWADSTRDDVLRTDAFGDQVAVELPIAPIAEGVPSPMMGHPGGRVNILQWRAAFQRDLDHGVPRIETLYPNAVIDLYPEHVLRATDARPYSGAQGMDNPVSRATLSPVLDQMAEGWGSMTVKPDQQADGRGVWRDGSWHVVITTPLATNSRNAPRLAPGSETMAAFAVWEGGVREVGSRKAWSAWVPLVLRP